MDDYAVICAKSSEVMESVAVPLWFTSLASVFLLRETGLRVVTAQHLFSSDMRQTDGLLFPPRPTAWCPPPTSIRIGLTSVLSPLTYMATRNGAKLPSEQPPGPPWILTFLILPSGSSLFVKQRAIFHCTLGKIWKYHAYWRQCMPCWTWWHIKLDNIKHWHKYTVQIVWEEQKRTQKYES